MGFPEGNIQIIINVISKKRGSAPRTHPPLKADKILNASKVFSM